MNTETVQKLLMGISQGKISVDDALDRLRNFPVDASEFDVKLDTHRELRTGVPEVVFCAGKTPVQVVKIMRRLHELHGCALGTRATSEMAEKVKQVLPDADFDALSGLIISGKKNFPDQKMDNFRVAILSGGTSDLGVAEEAAQTLEFLGNTVGRYYDVGVAGLHRLLDVIPQIIDAQIIISVAGMEGALTSVVAGLVASPVIGVPTSVGYGANLGGITALLAMLNSCASGVSVVNIDNGFGAAVTAHAIINKIREATVE